MGGIFTKYFNQPQTPKPNFMAITAATPFQSFEDMLKRAENQYKNYGCYELAEGNIQTMDDLMAKFNSQATWQNVYNTLLTGAKLHLDFCATPKEVFIDHRISGTVHTFTITIMSQGYVNYLAKRGIMVMAEVVKTGEIFEVNMGKVTAHRKDFALTDAPPMAVYAIATMPNGSERHVYFAWADVEKRKAKSKAKSGPWLEWPEEMAKAKVISALGKIIGQREFASAVAESEAVLEDWDNVNQDRPDALAEYDQTVAVEPIETPF